MLYIIAILDEEKQKIVNMHARNREREEGGGGCSQI